MILVILAAVFVILHHLDGATVMVNPAEVNSFREPRDTDSRLITPDPRAKCILSMVGGGIITTAETCAEVERAFAGEREQ